MQVNNGTYTGNGADARDITGVGFDPDVVLLLGSGSSSNAILKTADMPSNECKELIATTATASLPDRLTDLITDGFRVDNHATSNGNAITYWWLALRDNGAGDLKVGTYTGDGELTQAIAGVGFEPSAVWIFPDAGRLPTFEIAAAPTDPGVWAAGPVTGVIVSMDVDGFTVGNTSSGDVRVNANGETFYYVAIKDTDALFKQSTFTGNVTDDRDVAHGLGATPTVVLITNVSVSFDTCVWTDDFGSGLSTRVDGVTPFTNRIQSVDATNVNIGPETEVNGSADTMLMQVFAAGESSGASEPTISDITPATGPNTGGTAITITGTEFAAGAAVTIGGASATSIVVVDDEEITCVTPAGTTGAQDVVVTNTDTGTVTEVGGFTYFSTINITNVSPATGLNTGGTAVTITGTEFAAGATVMFGAASATSVVVVNDTTITAVTPARPAGLQDVTVTNTDTGTFTLEDGFLYTVSTGSSGVGSGYGLSPIIYYARETNSDFIEVPLLFIEPPEEPDVYRLMLATVEAPDTLSVNITPESVRAR